ncbi:MAG: glycosyltransferase family 2 protein [Proteobacteria bacterium]|nr:glycosyltransferase family 2 protein [Pseudomonadota bacterium]
MKVSCVIPTRDRKDMVQEAIASALAQRPRAPEVVVVDDGSTDGTAEALRSRFPRVRLVQTSGLGPGWARNLGAGAAGGDVLMFLDSDDVWRPGHVQALLDLVEQGFDVAYGVTRNQDALTGQTFFIPEPGREASGPCFHELVRWCFLVPSSAAVTRRAFDAAGGFGPERLGEDWLFFLELAARFPFGFTPEIITDRLLHPGSLCCLEQKPQAIPRTLDRIQGFIERSEAAGAEDMDRIRGMQALASEEGEQWRTIQDWYSSMKRHGLV